MSLWLLTTSAQAQAPTWVQATVLPPSSVLSLGAMRAVATDNAGNVLVVGTFTGSLTLGTTTLTGAGDYDFYLAKYLTATHTWAWAVRGGGTGSDYATGVAVQGGNIYVVGSLTNTRFNSQQVRLGSIGTSTGGLVQYGIGTGQGDLDLFVAKFADNGTSVTPIWSQVGGGNNRDLGQGIAVSGTNVYVTGGIVNDVANSQGVLFGGAGSALGTLPQSGTSTPSGFDIVVAKYIDNGPSATVAWTQVGGGSDGDTGIAIAASGNNVYVASTVSNTLTNATHVVFGGSRLVPGTLAQAGATTSLEYDWSVVKYIDNGPSATVAWSQVAGGLYYDNVRGIAVSGTSVYVTGDFTNSNTNISQAMFGGSGLVPGTVPQFGATANCTTDMVLAKYTDNGTSAALTWLQVGGGNSLDWGQSILVAGTDVYVTGTLTNTLANTNLAVFGGTSNGLGQLPQLGASTTSSQDILVAKYTDNGAAATFNWSQIAGSTNQDYGYGLALSGTRLLISGTVGSPATFGSLTLGSASTSTTGFLAELTIPKALATMPAAAGISPLLYPNPALGAATLSGATPYTAVYISDTLGRRVATVTADASGAAALPMGLEPGLYVVRAGMSTLRWVVE